MPSQAVQTASPACDPYHHHQHGMVIIYFHQIMVGLRRIHVDKTTYLCPMKYDHRKGYFLGKLTKATKHLYLAFQFICVFVDTAPASSPCGGHGQTPKPPPPPPPRSPSPAPRRRRSRPPEVRAGCEDGGGGAASSPSLRSCGHGRYNGRKEPPARTAATAPATGSGPCAARGLGSGAAPTGSGARAASARGCAGRHWGLVATWVVGWRGVGAAAVPRAG